MSDPSQSKSTQSEPLVLPARFNIADHFILPNLAPERIARPCLVCGGEALTFGALHEQSNRVAGALAGLGIRPGERVALLLRDSLLFPPAFWGAVRCGALPVPLNTVLTAPETRAYLADSEARVLIVDAEIWPRVAPALEGPGSPRHVLTVGLSVGGEIPGRPSLESLMAEAPPTFEAVTTTTDTPAFWLYTSGSTGLPKAAVHHQRDMAHVAHHYLRHVLRLHGDDLAYSAPKLSFAYGLGNSLYFPLASGSAAVIDPGPATAESAFAVLARHRPSVFYGVPSLFRAMVALHEARLAGRAPCPGPLPRLEHLRLAVSGGEVLPPTVLERWREHFGLPILDGVGSTEALHFYLANTPQDVAPGSAGRPVPGYDLRLVGEGGREVAPDEEGELWLRGEAVAAGYWRKPERTRAVFRDGWFATGDRFRRDGEGRYFFRGRVDDVFKAGGSWVNPEEVEQALLAHPGVAECAVVGNPDPEGLMEVLAYVVLGGETRDGSDDGKSGEGSLPVTDEALRAHLAGRLAPFKIPARFQHVDALPRTASGKVRRFLLREGNPGEPPRELLDGSGGDSGRGSGGDSGGPPLVAGG